MPSEELDQSRWFADEVRPHEADLRSYLRHKFPSLREIDDLVQETYARIVRARRLGKVVFARPYLFATARNCALDLHRRSQCVPMQSVGEFESLSVVEDKPDAAEVASSSQEWELLHEAIRSLPTRCREILVLRKFQGLSHAEIAGRLGIAENTVDAQLCIGVFRCREFLKARGVSGERLRQSHGAS